jgi:hypothetical protein
MTKEETMIQFNQFDVMLKEMAEVKTPRDLGALTFRNYERSVAELIDRVESNGYANTASLMRQFRLTRVDVHRGGLIVFMFENRQAVDYAKMLNSEEHQMAMGTVFGEYGYVVFNGDGSYK